MSEFKVLRGIKTSNCFNKGPAFYRHGEEVSFLAMHYRPISDQSRHRERIRNQTRARSDFHGRVHWSRRGSCSVQTPSRWFNQPPVQNLSNVRLAIFPEMQNYGPNSAQRVCFFQIPEHPILPQQQPVSSNSASYVLSVSCLFLCAPLRRISVNARFYVQCCLVL